jgi:subtilisin-like proprotein convertase family protein/regulation of enolase protein 1 (concanavalin A-like superfamily)
MKTKIFTSIIKKSVFLLFFLFSNGLVFGQTTFSAGSLPAVIPDGGNLNRTITVSGLPGTVATADEVQINVNIEHGWASDIVIGVTPPGGTEILIVNRINGGMNIDMVSANTLSFRSNAAGVISVALFGVIPAGVYLPSGANAVGSFSSLVGASRNGDWTIRVRDDDFIVAGSLTSASISFFGVVPDAPPVVLTCPTNTTSAACQTQAAVNAAFASWLATASASGGCNGVLMNNNTGAPSACGGSTTVTFTYTSTCVPTTTTCQATFIVASAPPVVLSCPTNTTSAACRTQAAVNTAFATWLASASASGGCNGVLTNNNTGAPSACGGSTTVTFTYTSTCVPTTTTCQATFIVASAPPVVLTCPYNTTYAAFQTQAVVNTAFATWLASASASGGCNGVLTNNNTGAPSACGGSTTVTFTYTSTCVPTTTTCQATFIVASAPPVVLSCPYNTTYAACQTQAAVNTAFATWLASASASGGCNGVLTNNNTGAPSAAGGSTTVTFTYTSTCVPFTTTCQATFAVASPTLVCGWSAEPNGVGCNNGNSVSYNNSTQTFSVNSNNCQTIFPYTSDAHAFAQTTLCGDGSITTLVNQASMSSNALAGLIMRETTMAGAKKAQLTINKAGMSSSSFRDVNNASATFLANAHINHFWLRITRTGNVFSTFVSLDGTTWKPVGTKTIAMASCINMGLIVHTSNVQMMIPPSTQGTASFSNTSTTGSGSAPARPNNMSSHFDQLAIADFKISPKTRHTG